ncbi:hypothetical protein [Paenibacillus wynnii]|uniref:Inhibitor of growth protein N-terminal histone-binding domain-containing protein n=1 Tax=Paenibacillus wynnii TaxID=268407 RepID=A0A098M966_9BACL|nr:hypothetical protein [Paenibacillus wynnii]KGE18072.1 hypothetical protein PWYN_26395 [Paenibacillus wynnii]
MKKLLLVGLIMVCILLSACSNEPAAIVSKEDIQAHVQQFFDEMSAIEQEGKSSLEDFNESLTSYSAGKASDKQLKKSIDKFQNTATDLLEQVNDVKISSGLPQDIRTFLEDSKIAFQSAYSLKEQASEGADSATVTAEQFKELNQNADLAMMYGISKLNEARVASGLVDAESTVVSK